jgi:DNA-binding transcriptional regulator YbjK
MEARARGAGREAILRAALRRIGRDGLHAVTHRDIAAEAGVSLGATTYHFATKDELLTEALLLFVTEETARLEAVAAAFEEGHLDAGEAVEAMAAELEATHAGGPEQVAQFELYLEATRRPAVAEAARRCVAAYALVAVAALRAAGVTEPERVAPLAVALLDGLALHRLAGGRTDWAETELKPALRWVAGLEPAPALPAGDPTTH